MGLSSAIVNAQNGKLPPFRLFQNNHVLFKAEQLPIGKPIILIYFLPDCDHCQKLTKNIAEHIDDFNRFSVVMATYYPVTTLDQFAKRYGLDKHSNFYLGTEGNSFFLKKYYNLSKVPFAAVYSKSGDLIKTYNNENFFTSLFNDLKSFK